MQWAERTFEAVTAQFGPLQPCPEHQDAEIVLADPLDGSELLDTNAGGKIVLMQQSTIFSNDFTAQAWNAQNAGAVAAVVYSSGNNFHSLTGEDPRITIPVLSIGPSDGNELAAAIKLGTTAISLQGV